MNHHPQCQDDQDHQKAPLPTRLLDVASSKGENYVQLHETQHERGQYIALSYVWGKGREQFMTNQSNLESNKAGIPLEQLSKTIQHAVLCTRRMGLQFLWVDTLCIVQDDSKDKEKELKNMANIYKSALFTISAAKATHCDVGFLDERTAITDRLFPSCYPLQMKVPADAKRREAPSPDWQDRAAPTQEEIEKDYKAAMAKIDAFMGDMHKKNAGAFHMSNWQKEETWLPENGTIWLVPSEDDKNFLVAPTLSTEPISARAWTFQESWLSPRQLIYGSGQMQWRCRTSSLCDGGTVSIWDRNSQEPSKDRFGKPNPFRAKDEPQGHTMEWEKVISEYTRRNLSFAADKFNALLGIANEFEFHHKDELVAGVWKNCIVEGLGWYQCLHKKDSELIHLSTSREVPSWCWAKVDGAVHFNNAENTELKDTRLEVHECTPPGSHNLAIRASVTVTGPMITMVARQIPRAFQIWVKDNPPAAIENVIYPDGGISNPDLCQQKSKFSKGNKFNVPEQLWFLELSCGLLGSAFGNSARGLVLIAIEGKPETYRRTGYFVVAMEYDKNDTNIIMNPFSLPEERTPTPFGEGWRERQEMKTITLE